MALLAGIEAGGTKFICAVASEPGHVLKEERVPTSSPQETLEQSLRFFKDAEKALKAEHGNIEALGIGSFGPVDLRHQSKTYGHITSTPKPSWEYVDICGFFARNLSIPIDFETDVNAAAIGEGYGGAGRGLQSFMYITVGTGIGAGIIIHNKPVHGLLHPEAGHVLLQAQDGDTFPGTCPYHGRCLEGLCSGPAIEKRWGLPAEALDPEHKAWDIEAYYLAQALMTYTLTLSPERIIIGGGVMHQIQLFPKIRSYLKDLLNGYIVEESILEHSETFIVSPGLEDKAGITGALVMAHNLLNN